jgi:hypothetical protein
MTRRALILLLAVAVLLHVAVPALAQTDADRSSATERRWPQVRFTMLTDPSVAAADISSEGRISVAGDTIHPYGHMRRFALGYEVKGTVPFDYHPNGMIRGNAEFGLNWLVSGEGTRSEILDLSVRRRYQGSLNVLLGELEVGRDTAAWRLRTLDVGVQLRQAIPYTMKVASMLQTGDRPAGVTPLVVAVAGKRVFDADQVDSSATRLDLAAHWQIPLYYGLYLYPQLDANWQDKVRSRAFFTGEILLVLSEQLTGRLGGLFEPILFARYVEGRQSPNFRLVRGWEFGIGTNVCFSKS